MPAGPRSRFAPSVMESVTTEPATRQRELAAWATARVASPDVGSHLADVASAPNKKLSALESLVQLTLWQEENQREVVHLGGLPLLAQLITDSDADIAISKAALTLLNNVTSQEDTAGDVAALPGFVARLTELLASKSDCISALSARCLINLTHSSPDGLIAAFKAKTLLPAVTLFVSNNEASIKLGAWLLSNLVAPLGSPCRASLLQQKAVINKAVEHLSSSTTPDASLVVICRLTCGLARSGVAAQTSLSQAGALDALETLVEKQTNSEVIAASLQALCALTINHPANTAVVVKRASLVSAITKHLEARSSPWEATNEDAGVVLAAHTLIHVVGHMLANTVQSKRPTEDVGQCQASHGVVQLQGNDSDLLDGSAELVVPAGGGDESPCQQAVYISLSRAAHAMHVQLPLVMPLPTKTGEPALTTTQAAELRYRVTHVLLPKLSSTNTNTASNAAACIYHLVASCGGATAQEARRLVADTAMLERLLHLLSSGNAMLVQTCLAVLDVLCGEPACAKVVMSIDWMDAVTPLLDSSDALVCRWAERTLCSLYVATGTAHGVRK